MKNTQWNWSSEYLYMEPLVFSSAYNIRMRRSIRVRIRKLSLGDTSGIHNPGFWENIFLYITLSAVKSFSNRGLKLKAHGSNLYVYVYHLANTVFLNKSEWLNNIEKVRRTHLFREHPHLPVPKAPHGPLHSFVLPSYAPLELEFATLEWAVSALTICEI